MSETRTVFTIEVIHGPSEEVNQIILSIVRLGAESAVAVARSQMVGRTDAPKITFYEDGRMPA